MCPDKGLFPRVVEVVPHQEVEQLRRVRPDGAQLGVTALEHLIAQRGAHVCSPLVERRGELEQNTGRQASEVSAPGRRQETCHQQYNHGLEVAYLVNQGP